MATTRPKKSDPFGVRFDSEEQRLRFVEACAESGMAPADALRMAAQAMVVSHLRFGRIPRDMEIRQVQIGDMQDMQALLARVAEVAETQANYLTKNSTGQAATPKAQKPPDKPQRHRGDGPHRKVS